MTRGTIPMLPSHHPLGEQLPSVYLEDSLTQRFTGGLDTVLAPVFLTLDCLEAYLDPRLAPADFLLWLASWVGLEVDETWPESRLRAAVGSAALLHRRRGTRRGVVDFLELLTDGEVELVESEQTIPVRVRVTVRVNDPASINRATVERTIRANLPAGVRYELEILARGSARR
jgi:phage tail-like protein